MVLAQDVLALDRTSVHGRSGRAAATAEMRASELRVFQLKPRNEEKRPSSRASLARRSVLGLLQSDLSRRLSQDGSYLAEFLLEKGYNVHGIIRRSSSFNTARIDHIFDKVNLHYGEPWSESKLIRIAPRTWSTLPTSHPSWRRLGAELRFFAATAR